MKLRMAVARTTFAARLTALGWGALTLLVPVAVSACSGSSSTPTVPGSPSVTISATTTTTVTASGSDGGTTPGSSVPSSVPATQTVTPQVTVTVTVTPSPTVTPTAAPITGGGGTAGLQHVVLFGVGAAAILAGAGSLAYRRWLSRGR